MPTLVPWSTLPLTPSSITFVYVMSSLRGLHITSPKLADELWVSIHILTNKNQLLKAKYYITDCMLLTSKPKSPLFRSTFAAWEDDLNNKIGLNCLYINKKTKIKSFSCQWIPIFISTMYLIHWSFLLVCTDNNKSYCYIYNNYFRLTHIPELILGL